jgi:hypothetical protein
MVHITEWTAIVINYVFDDIPSFGIVWHIFVDENVEYFIVEETDSDLDCDIFQQVPFHELKFYWPWENVWC